MAQAPRATAAASIAPDSLRCDWRALIFGSNREPPSWSLGDQALSAGASGILFPSLRSPVQDALNLVVFVEHLKSGDGLGVHDPRGVLR